ncbi:MAG: lysophospholipase [Litorimonas sp.]
MDDCHILTLTSADGTSLLARHWEATGPRATLAIVHGFGEHSGRYGPMANHLADNGVQVVAADLRGHGRSEGKRGRVRSYDDFRGDLDALLARARDLHASVNGPLVLFGHSMGGGVVLDYGLSGRAEVNGVIASAPLITMADAPSKGLERVVRLLAKVLPGGAIKQPIVGDKISTLKAEQDEYVRDALNHGEAGFRLAVEMVDIGRSIAARAGEWDLPLLVLHSEDDQLTDFAASRDFADRAGAQFVAMRGVAHEMHNDTSRPRVYRAVLDFLERPDVRRKKEVTA